MTRLYVGNIRFTADEPSLRTLFEAFGPVREVYIGIDRETGRSRGFAFVTMVDQGGAQAAMNGLHGKEVDGRVLVVNEAQPRQARGAGEGGGSHDRGPARGGDRGMSRSGDRPPGASRAWSGGGGGGRGSGGGSPGGGSHSGGGFAGRRDSSSGRQSSHFSSSSGGSSSDRPPSGGRSSKGGKPSGRERDREWDRERERERDRDKQKFDREDEW